MLKKIREYLIFVPSVYRIIMFAVLPLVSVGGYIAAAVAVDEVYCLFWFVLIPILSVPVEIIADNWMFGGIQEKETAEINFLRTSAKGMGVLRNAVTLDLIRRLFTLAVIMGAFLLVNIAMDIKIFEKSWGASFGLTVGMVLISYIWSVLGTLITRFCTNFWGNVLVGYFADMFTAPCILVFAGIERVLAADCILAALAAGATYLAVRVAMSRVEKNYIDR